MEQNKIDLFVMSNVGKFSSQDFVAITEKLQSLPKDQGMGALIANYRSPFNVFLLSLYFGLFGVDRFILGEIGLGILNLLTCGGFGIWAFIDVFTAQKRTKDYNLYKFCKSAGL